MNRFFHQPGPGSGPKLKPLDWPALMVWLLMLVFALFFSMLAIQQHLTFQTNGLDLGNVDQALWNTAHGDFLRFTLMTPVQSRLALHVEPILLLLVPLYWLNLGSPVLLLAVQAGVVALGAWPLYQLSIVNYQLSTVTSKYKRRNWGLVLFPLAYLLLPTLEAAVLYDFHAVTLASTFLLFAFWALERRRNGTFLVFGVLAMACKEDIPLVVAMMGLYAGLARRRWRLAGLTVGLSLAWFTVAFFIIQPRFAAGGNIQLDRYAWLGTNPWEMIQTMLTRPNLVFDHLWYQANLPDYLARLFFPTAFLALLSPLTLLPLLPSLAVNLLSANPFTWRLEDFHYGAPMAPFLFISAIYGIRRLSNWLAPAGSSGDGSRRSNPSTALAPALFTALALLLFVFSVVYHYHRGFTPLARTFSWPRITPHHRQLEQVVDTIPPDAALFTQSNLAPHLSQRAVLYTDFAYFTDPGFPAIPVDDILLDVTGLENIGGLHQYLRQTLLDRGRYQIVTGQDGILHLKPRSPDDHLSPTDAAFPPDLSLLPPSFFTFIRPDSPAQYTPTIDFGDAVRLHGYSLHFNREEEVQVSLDLEPLQPLSDLQPVLYLLDVLGHPLGATVDLPPALVWFPPEQWPPGESVRVRFNTLPWHTRADSILVNPKNRNYGLALGMVAGEDVWDLARREKPGVQRSEQEAIRVPADGTLVQLAHIEQRWGIPAGGPQVRRFKVPGIPHPIQASFEEQVELLGYTTPQLAATDPGVLKVELYWQAITRPQRLTRFVQLVGPDGNVYSQIDSAPDLGHYPTALWQPGEVVIDPIALPVPDPLPAGPYRLHVGLYRPDTGQRVLLKRSGGDHIEIELPFFNGK